MAETPTTFSAAKNLACHRDFVSNACSHSALDQAYLLARHITVPSPDGEILFSINAKQFLKYRV
jgi:hypothetical protein